MKVEHTIEYLMRIKGFRHGAANLPCDEIHAAYQEYREGYNEGLVAYMNYIESTRRFLSNNPNACKDSSLLNFGASMIEH